MSLDFGKIITSGEGIVHTNNKRIDKFCRGIGHGHHNDPSL